MENRIITSGLRPEDEIEEMSLRPKSLDTYIGQENVKNNLKVFYFRRKKRKGLGSCAFMRPSGAWKNNSFEYNIKRNGC